MLSRRARLIGSGIAALVVVIIAGFMITQSMRISLGIPFERSASQVAYIKFDDNGQRDADVYLLDVESGTTTQLTTNNRVKGATWSANGESLVVWADEKRLELLANGQTQTLPDSKGYTPILSPDQTHFAYDNCLYDAGRYGWSDSTEIVVGETNTTNTRIIKNACFPSWSPSGDQIAYTSQQSDDADPEIYIENMDGSNLHRLITNPSADVFAKWSSTDRIAFRTVSENDPDTIYRVDAHGKNLVSIDQSIRDTSPIVWSSDGQTLLYTNAFDKLCVLKDDADTPDCFLENVFDVVWSPDGTQAIYTKTKTLMICLTDPLAEVIVEKRCFPGTENAMFPVWRPGP